jgi:hypothetical protein
MTTTFTSPKHNIQGAKMSDRPHFGLTMVATKLGMAGPVLAAFLTISGVLLATEAGASASATSPITTMVPRPPGVSPANPPIPGPLSIGAVQYRRRQHQCHPWQSH